MADDCIDEETAAALLAGNLPTDDVQRIEEHADVCSACREFISALAAAAPALPSASPENVSPLASTSVGEPKTPSVPLFTRGDKLGRFIVLERLGMGGMGVVYAAYDPELDRRVAVKLLRGFRSTQDVARARLLREAQALARLNDPHVVTVHDIGTYEDHVFLSMEFVDGGTLSQWNKGGPRDWRKVLSVFLAAGRGLAAAHHAGLVHRDFKPDNVLIGKDGRARVTDFGLARDLGRSDSDERAPSPSPPVEVLTQTGAVLGTPAYMAPEQRDGRPADARSDQFSYCVSLYEALYGVRPGPEPGDPPSAHGVPARLKRILARGLLRDPDARYPTMDALLDELGADPSLTRRRAIGASLLALVVAAGVAVPLFLARRQSQLCSGGAARLMAVWNDARRAAVKKAVLATHVSWAASAAAEATATLDDYGQKWIGLYTDACQATRVRGEQTENALELRMSCLDGRLDDLDAMAGALSRTDDKKINRVIQAAHALPPLPECSDVAALAAPLRPPADKQLRAKVDDARKRLATLRALYNTGDFAETHKRAAALVEELGPLGYAPVSAEAMLLVGQVQQRQGDYEAAVKSYTDAALAAESATADDTAATAWARMVGAEADGGHLAEAHKLLPQAEAAVRRLRGRRGDVESKLYRDVSDLWRVEGKFPESIAAGQHALERAEAYSGSDSLDTAYSLSALGTAYGSAWQHQQAFDYHEKSDRIFFRIYPPGHPQRDSCYTNLAADLYNLGRYKESNDMLESLVATQRARPGKPMLELAWGLLDLGEGYASDHLYDKALTTLNEALALRESIAGPNHIDLTPVLARMSSSLLALHRPEEALAAARRGIAIVDSQGPSTFYTGEALVTAGDAAEALGQRNDARRYFERAVKLSLANKQPIETRGQAMFGLARLTWADGDHAGGIAQAEAAAKALAVTPALHQELTAANDWLAKHR